MSFRLSAEQQHQIMSLDGMGAASLRRAIGWGITDMSVLCRHVWTDEAAFNGVCDALKKEALRAWLVRVSGVFPLVQWSMMKQTVWMCDFKDCDLYAPTRTYEQLEKLRNFVVERMEQAPRVPLPDATRQTILRLKQELVEKQHYTDLCNTYIRAFVNPSKNDYSVTNDWTRVDFADDAALKRFQVHVDRAERLLLHQKIEKAINDYPTTKWVPFKQMIVAHFGDRAIQLTWWAKDDVPLEDLRVYLDLLGHYDLDTVEEMTRKKKKEETAASAPTPVRVPIPEWTRKTILKFVFDPAVEREYIVLKNYYMQYLCPPELRNGGWADWRVHFIDEKDVANFQARVDQVERYWLIARIRAAIDAYPLSKYAEFNSMVEKRFGVKAKVMEWYTYMNCSLEEMRFYLEMLGEHNLNKVKLMIEPTILNCVALFDCTATETKSKAAEPEVPTPAPLTLVERKIRFLCQLHGKDLFWTSLASYMDLPELSCNLEGIARKVSLNDDEARLSEWEAIINKTNPEHIFWKLLDHQIGEVERPILKGLADLPTNSDSRSVQQRILFFWSTYKQPKRELICAYLDTLPKKVEK